MDLTPQGFVALYNSKSDLTDIVKLAMKDDTVVQATRLFSVNKRVTYFATQRDAIIYDDNVVFVDS